MPLGALRGSRPAALALVALDAAALFVALRIDLPDSRPSGRLPESVSHEDAHARPGKGLYGELLGGGLLIVAGGGLLIAPAGGHTWRQGPPRSQETSA